jgi:hypothetical protein
MSTAPISASARTPTVQSAVSAPLNTGEDHDLWRRLGQAGYRLSYAADTLVTTSARLRGRATGGLADLLYSLENGAA